MLFERNAFGSIAFFSQYRIILKVVVMPKIMSLEKNFSVILRFEMILSVVYYERKNIISFKKKC